MQRLTILAVFLLIWLIVLLPLKLVAVATGGAAAYGYRDVYGTVWSGRAYGVQLAGEAVQEIEVSLQPLALLRGAVRARWRASDDSLRGRGIAELAGDRVRAESVNLVVDLGRFGIDAVPGLDPAEPVYITVNRLEMDGDRCVEAAGDLRTGALIAPARAYAIEAPMLTGQLDCREGELVLAWSGESDAFSLAGDVILRSSSYEWTVQAATQRGELTDMFALAGLVRDGDIWRGEGEGRYGG